MIIAAAGDTEQGSQKGNGIFPVVMKDNLEFNRRPHIFSTAFRKVRSTSFSMRSRSSSDVFFLPQGLGTMP